MTLLSRVIDGLFKVVRIPRWTLRTLERFLADLGSSGCGRVLALAAGITRRVVLASLFVHAALAGCLVALPSGTRTKGALTGARASGLGRARAGLLVTLVHTRSGGLPEP